MLVNIELVDYFIFDTLSAFYFLIG